jgi:hypothetical protein
MKPKIRVREVTDEPSFPEFEWKVVFPGLKGAMYTVDLRRWPITCHTRDAAYRVAYNFVTTDGLKYL